jgi:hypothetical protein
MMKGLVVIASVALAMQSVPPLTGQTAGDRTDKSGKNAQTKNDATAQSIAVQPTAISPTTDGNLGQVAKQDENKSETLTRIRGLPPVSIADKSKAFLDYLFDWGPWCFSLFLVVVGIIGVIFARRTLNAIEDQATRMKEQVDRMDTQASDARTSAAQSAATASSTLSAIEEQARLMKLQAALMERQTAVMEAQTKTTEVSVAAAIRSADSSQHGVDALVNSERSWVMVNRTAWPHEHGWYAPDFPQYRPGMAFEFEVSGKTPARITESRFILVPVPATPGTTPLEPELPLPPDYTNIPRSPEIPDDGRMFAPERKFQIMLGLSRNLSLNEWEDLRDQNTLMCAYGRIKYDSLGHDRETAVCYVFRFHFGGVFTSTDGTVLNPHGFEIGGPAAYNRST